MMIDPLKSMWTASLKTVGGRRLPLLAGVLLALALGRAEVLEAGELKVGGATVSITPELPVALSGQMHTRIAREIDSEVTATAIALESVEDGKAIDQAIMVSCDLVTIREGILELVRERLEGRLPGFDLSKLFLSATHTHTGPVLEPGRYQIPEEGVTQPAAYREFLADRVAGIAVEAWENRKPGAAGWGLGHAVVATNRRVVYADGSAQMYGSTGRLDFREVEGYEDHGVEVLFFWDAGERLIATAINVACPAQEVESLSRVSADFWHPVREQLKAKHGEDLLVLAWTGAAGDQSPHLMMRKAAEERMRKLRGLDRLDEIARRIVIAWEEAYEGARRDIRTDVPLVHEVRDIELPLRQVTDGEFENARKKFAELSTDVTKLRRALWYQDVMDRYQRQRDGSAKPYRMELHVLRLGDVAIATNPFELFTDYGIQMKARSPSLQTFVVQLTGPGTYLPTARAVRGGSYSAVIESNEVGPEGGQVLVEETLGLIQALWPAE